jgi:hypothetical protein
VRTFLGNERLEKEPGKFKDLAQAKNHRQSGTLPFGRLFNHFGTLGVDGNSISDQLDLQNADAEGAGAAVTVADVSRNV